MKHTTARLLALIMPVRKWMLGSIFFGALTVASGIGLMGTSNFLISMAALHPSIAALNVAIVGVRFFGIARGVFRYAERLTTHEATLRLLTNLRVWFYAAIEPLVPAAFSQNKQSSGDILSRVVSDIDTLQNFYTRVIAPPLIAILIGIGVFLFLGAYAGIFALTYIAFYLVIGLLVPFVTHKLSRHTGEQIVQIRAQLSSYLVDGIQGMADLVAFGMEERQLAQIQKLNNQLISLQKRLAHMRGLQATITNLLINVTGVLILLLAIPMVLNGQLNGFMLAPLMLATIASFEAVQPLPAAWQDLGSNLQAAKRLFEVADTPATIKEPEQAGPEPRRYDIQLKDITFRYTPEDMPALHHIDLDIPDGSCVALVGVSGAGKSSVLRLLLRFWEYQEGAITLGGYDLRRFRQEDITRITSVVSQETYLFNTTIRENLLLARPEATEEELIRAAKQAQIHDFISGLPEGYDTRVGEQGYRFSGGERQRLAIARAFLKDAPIVLLDEPTVNLDPVSERKVLQAIRELRKGRTTVLITHRLIDMDMADTIAVFQEGQIVERGTHQELLRQEGMYWRLWKQQHSMLASRLEIA
ncbi:ATP-binding cassette subfamily C protein CydC [Thermosporothrix hazakensis]|jgi:ATP-binding cassette subfamily C protein CydC|uniref:ATP-binding cassette subfamily C protein CydC n=1 Tax=Thermosporothrix hazakensis TaxID=644383 RepID=A0A326TZL7_THEHA|nr:thiol reductant ABC exporter subunit CydC [Thermosporothrix hazakensis]PZW22928.1 ATP-binding cassette subfamily C protein CydC [Thermosporothrix hazakensis]GCE47983.1 thiol reductant ABC exporter subunit CydC [Thermosporothrix hazakensis]